MSSKNAGRNEKIKISIMDYEQMFLLKKERLILFIGRVVMFQKKAHLQMFDLQDIPIHQILQNLTSPNLKEDCSQRSASTGSPRWYEV